jgi:hypothetical protein
VAASAPKVIKKQWNLAIIFCFSLRDVIQLTQNLHNFKEANYNILIVGFEAHTVVTVKNSAFWGVIPCGSLKGSLCFGGMCRLHLQG